MQTSSILSLSELSARIASVFRQSFGATRFWVTAEIINLKISRGHCYLQLAEKDDFTTTPKAEFRGIIWGTNFAKIQAKFQRETGRVLQEQLQILCSVEVQFHERYGLSLLIQDIDASYTLGQLELERRRTIETLTKEGIIHKNKELLLPEVIQRIAVISAIDSKGYEDFYTTLKNNSYGYYFYYKLYPSLLQGDLAANDIIQQLDKISRSQTKEKYDAVIIVRGGGGASSLECFNNYNLAKTIALFHLPVITGIGHTTNKSVVDEVANIDLITPTEAAVFLTERISNYESHVLNCMDLIKEYSLEKISNEKIELQNCIHAVSTIVNLNVSNEKHTIEMMSLNLEHHCDHTFNNEYSNSKHILERIKTAALSKIILNKHILNQYHTSLPIFVDRKFKTELEYLNQRNSRVRLSDPVEVLKRGYSYTLIKNKFLQNSDEVIIGEEITTVLASGKLKSKLIDIQNG